jgi:DNA recombination protein RmuC
MVTSYSFIGLISTIAIFSTVFTYIYYLYRNTQRLLTSAIGNIANLTQEKLEIGQQLSGAQQQLHEKDIDLASISTEFKIHKEQEQQKEQWFQEKTDQLHQQFKYLATQVLSDNQQTFKQQSQTTITDSLSPLKEEISKLHQQAVTMSQNDQQERSALRATLDIYRQDFAQSCASLNKEAVNLTRALQGDNKAQGNWGEMMLERILESVGLQKGREYDMQQTFKNNDGKLFRPDVIVHLPDKKDIIIDSKVSLTAYNNAMQSDGADQEKYLQQHILSLKNHIKELSSKDYASLENINTVDSVIMFIPIEASYVAAIKHDSSLFEYAFDRKIILAHPVNLWSSLKIVQSLWRNADQNKNAQQIADLAGKMYDKLYLFADDLAKLQASFNKSQELLAKAKHHVTDGKGNLVGRAEKLRQLGAKNSKMFEQDIIEKSRQSEQNELLLAANTAPIAQLDRASPS